LVSAQNATTTVAGGASCDTTQFEKCRADISNCFIQANGALAKMCPCFPIFFECTKTLSVKSVVRPRSLFHSSRCPLLSPGLPRLQHHTRTAKNGVQECHVHRMRRTSLERRIGPDRVVVNDARHRVAACHAQSHLKFPKFIDDLNKFDERKRHNNRFFKVWFANKSRFVTN
jgi:hypothetical protein